MPRRVVRGGASALTCESFIETLGSSAAPVSSGASAVTMLLTESDACPITPALVFLAAFETPTKYIVSVLVMSSRLEQSPFKWSTFESPALWSKLNGSDIRLAAGRAVGSGAGVGSGG